MLLHADCGEQAPEDTEGYLIEVFKEYDRNANELLETEEALDAMVHASQ